METAEPKVILSLMFFTMSFAFFFVSTLTYIGYWVTRKVWVGQTATALTCVASFSILMVLIFRTIESGHAPFSNLFESMVLFVWALSVGYLMMEWRYKMKVMGAFVMGIATLSMLAAHSLPYKFKSISPLNPALQNKWHWMVDLLESIDPKLTMFAIGWLDFHVFTTFISYAAFAIAFGLSLMYLLRVWFDERKKTSRLVETFPEARVLDEMSYRTIAWGFPFLLIGIVSGAMWANYAWGTYWSWDPKETWSLITWFIYAAYLHARVARGWRGKRAAYISIAGFLAVIFLYWGVSFILPGLHAYA